MSGSLEEATFSSDYQVSSSGLSQGNSHYSNSSGQRNSKIKNADN